MYTNFKVFGVFCPCSSPICIFLKIFRGFLSEMQEFIKKAIKGGIGGEHMFYTKGVQSKLLNDEELLLKDVKTIVASSAPDEIKTKIIREMLLIFAEKSASTSNNFHQKVSDAMAVSGSNKQNSWFKHLISK